MARRLCRPCHFILYPNALAQRSPALNDVRFHWLYPGGFSPAAMELTNLRIDGAPAPVTIDDLPLVARQAIASAPLAKPLAPGEAVTVDVDFVTRIPRRYGAFGCDGARCRLMGGFYPVPARPGSPVSPGAPRGIVVDRAGRTRISLKLPPRLALVVDGQPIVNDGGGPFVVEADDVRTPTIVTDEVLRPATLSVGAHVVRYLHRRPRPPSSNDQPMPYVREDIAGLVLETARQSLLLADAAGFPRDLPLTLVEAPLRHDLVQQHGDVILVSDQIFRIFPFDRLRKYHRMEIARAVFATVADAAVRAHEAPVDRDRAAGVLAAYLTDVYTRAEFRYIEYFRELLAPIDFVPAVDQLMYAPLLASPSTYFGDVDDRDEIRDGVWRFADARSGPRLLYNKLLDLVGPARFPTLARKLYVEQTPLRRAAADAVRREPGLVLAPVARRVPGRELSPGHRARRAGRRARHHCRPARRRDHPRARRGEGGRSRGRRADLHLERRRAVAHVRRRAAGRSRLRRGRSAPSPRRDGAGLAARRSTIRAWTTAIRRAGGCSTTARARCSTSRRRRSTSRSVCWPSRSTTCAITSRSRRTTTRPACSASP